MILVSREISDLKSEFEGGVALRVNWLTTLRRAGDNTLDKINPESLKRKVPIYGGLAKGLSIYYCPVDVLVPSDLYANDGIRKYRYMPPAQFYTHPTNDRYTIEYINGVRFIVIRHSEDNSVYVLNEMDTTTGLVYDAGMVLENNTHNYLSGSGAVQSEFNDVTHRKIGATLATAKDISEFTRGVAIIPINFKNAKDIVSVELRLLTSTGNYFSMISTSDSVGDNFINDWNQVRFFIENRTSTGSPVVTSIASWELYVTTSTGTSQIIIVDRMTLQKSAMHYLEYYSNRIFIDGTTKAWKEEAEAVTDLINLNRDALGILHYEACRLVIQSATFSKTDSQESKRFDSELARKYDQYFARHPSSEMPLSYNISPNVALEVPLQITLVPEEPLVIASTSSGIVFVSNETPSGTVNSINKSFALTRSPNPTNSLMLYLNGQLQIQAVDYTLTGSSITFIIAPTTGSYLTAFYRYTS